jgi:N-glycosylase/DNA lyase
MHKTEFTGDTVKIQNLEHFDPETTLFSGQAFRWRKEGGAYRGVAHAKVVELSVKDGEALLYPVTEAEYRRIWEHYFDLKRDYGALMGDFKGDAILRDGMDFASGMRVLNQEPFETLISFIISANNNIARITGIVERLSGRFGERLEYGGKEYFAFPEPEALANAAPGEIAACGAGYRAPYIQDAARAVAGGFDLAAVRQLPYEEAKARLGTLKGVGPKVADCILLYSLGFAEAFPLDVWMKRVVYNLYGFREKSEKELRAFIAEKFGKNAGIAQQYLFHYTRMNKLGLEDCQVQKKPLTSNPVSSIKDKYA